MAVDDYQPGSMDIRAHRETWEGFVAVVKWSSIALAVLLLAMRAFLI